MKSNENHQEVTAEVTFLSATGQDPLDKEITSKNVMEFLPDNTSVASVQSYFEKQNIAFRYDQGISATITAEREVFENLFGISLKRAGNHFIIKNQNNGLIVPLKKLPEEVQNEISNISLPSQMETF